MGSDTAAHVPKRQKVKERDRDSRKEGKDTDGVKDKEDRWHPFHYDTTLDTTLRSDDGMLFKVSSFRLAQSR